LWVVERTVERATAGHKFYKPGEVIPESEDDRVVG
jgi:hypothetical protein